MAVESGEIANRDPYTHRTIKGKPTTAPAFLRRKYVRRSELNYSRFALELDFRVANISVGGA